jgi:hypothetical protein
MTHYCKDLEIQAASDFVQNHIFTTADSGEYIFEYATPALSFTEEVGDHCSIEIVALIASDADLNCDDSE